MAKVLTSGSKLVCAHQGTVNPNTSQSKLKVDGKQVLVLGDLLGATISGCITPASTSSKPCTTVVSMISGTAIKMKVDGKAVLLDSAAGLTDGLPAGSNTWSVQSAGQTKLDTL